MARRVRKTYKQKQRELEAPEIIEEQLWSLSDWMEQNWRPVVGIVGGLALLWGGIGLYQIMADSSARTDAQRTAAVFEAAGRSIYTPPADLKDEDPNKPLGKTWGSEKERAAAIVAAATGSEDEAGGLVGVLGGAGKARQGDFSAQLAAIDKALAGQQGTALELPLREQRASALTGSKRFDEAAAEWQKVAALTPTAFGKATAQLHVGDLFNPNVGLGKADAAKAKAAYQAAVKAARVGDKEPADGPLAFVFADASTKLSGL